MDFGGLDFLNGITHAAGIRVKPDSQNFDILRPESWCLEEDGDKFLESIRYGDTLNRCNSGVLDDDLLLLDDDPKDSPLPMNFIDEDPTASTVSSRTRTRSILMTSEDCEDDQLMMIAQEVGNGDSVESNQESYFTIDQGNLSPSESFTSSVGSGSETEIYEIEEQPQHGSCNGVSVVQLLGILPPGVKTIQFVQPEGDTSDEMMVVRDDEDGEESEGGHASISSSASTSSEKVHSSVGSTFQELKLSDEEKRLLMKEGVSLPKHYPLTKFEERELKRIRRKIRNKISAQDSRKRKKEFLDKLQQKVLEVEDEKTQLTKRVRTLEAANAKLSAQVKRLQTALSQAGASFRGSNGLGGQNSSVVPAATTLLVLILSLALVVLPGSVRKGAMTAVAKQQPGTYLLGMDANNQAPETFDSNASTSAEVNPKTNLNAFSMPNAAYRSRTMMGVLNTDSYWRSVSNVLDDVDEDDDGSFGPPVKIPRFTFQQKSVKGLDEKMAPAENNSAESTKNIVHHHRAGVYMTDLEVDS